MSARQLVVLGTASQAPTRYRNHNGYLLRWDTAGILFDPGEGTQRQFTFAGASPTAITTICVSHFHGDHCLGLPGVLQRLSLDRVTRPIAVHYPASGQAYFDRLRHASIFDDRLDVIARPVDAPADAAVTVDDAAAFRLLARRLDHRADSVGWRLEEPDGRRMLPDKLDRLGVRGPDVGALHELGVLTVGGRDVTLEEVSEVRRGQRFAFVMDTRLCDGAFELAAGADLLVCEATFLQADAQLAHDYGHLTAGQAGRIAAEAGARRLVLTHFSQRYPDAESHRREAEELFGDVVVAEDLMRVDVPKRTEPDVD